MRLWERKMAGGREMRNKLKQFSRWWGSSPSRKPKNKQTCLAFDTPYVHSFDKIPPLRYCVTLRSRWSYLWERVKALVVHKKKKCAHSIAGCTFALSPSEKNGTKTAVEKSRCSINTEGCCQETALPMASSTQWQHTRWFSRRRMLEKKTNTQNQYSITSTYNDCIKYPRICFCWHLAIEHYVQPFQSKL